MQHRRCFRGLACPRCRAADGLVVCVATLALHCTWCARRIDRTEVDATRGRWRALLAWLEAAEVPAGDTALKQSAEAI